MTNREYARYAALHALVPFVQSRLEDMADSDHDCLFLERGNAAFALAKAALHDGTTPRELAHARSKFEELDRYVSRRETDLAETCGPNCPCKTR